MKNKIILINTIPAPLEGKPQKSNVSPGLLSIGTWLTKNSKFNVRLIDCIVEENYLELIKKELQDKDVLLVGLSVMSSCIPNALEITRMVKKFDASIKIIWGGVHCRLYPEQTIKYPLIDFIAYEEGEKPMLNLANCLAKNKSPAKVKGIFYKVKDKIIQNPPEELIDLNELGIMNYDLLNQKVFDGGEGSIYTSRGCPHRCTFCINVVTKNRKWRALSSENVIKEIEYVLKKYPNTKIINFRDDCFFVSKERANKILDELLKKKRKLKFTTSTRIDYFRNGLIDENILKKMKGVGFYNLNLGAEFGSQKMLDFIKKDIKKEDILQCVKLLKGAGIGGTFAFMTGFPTETREDIMESINIIKKMCNMNQGVNVVKENGKVYEWRDKVRISGPDVYRPYPGGELYDFVVQNYGWKTPEKLEEWEPYFRKNIRYNIEDYPWIKGDPHYVIALQFYVKIGKLNFSTFIQRLTLPYSRKLKIFTILFYPFARIRMLLNFFNYPIEYNLAKKFNLLKGLEN